MRHYILRNNSNKTYIEPLSKNKFINKFEQVKKTENLGSCHLYTRIKRVNLICSEIFFNANTKSVIEYHLRYTKALVIDPHTQIIYIAINKSF